jgi:hypothetical protein
LRPIVIVTEPYLKFFRKQIPTIAGFDISAIPAIFLLDILSQTAVAIGADIPKNFNLNAHKSPFQVYEVKKYNSYNK